MAHSGGPPSLPAQVSRVRKTTGRPPFRGALPYSASCTNKSFDAERRLAWVFAGPRHMYRRLPGPQMVWPSCACA